MIIGFIGAGKMARALAAGIVRSRVAKATDLLCSSRTQKSGQSFLDLFPEGDATWTSDTVALVKRCDLNILAIKPQIFPEVVPALRDVSAGKLFLSLATGVSLEKMRDWLHPTARIIRSMPNIPMQVGAGASVYAEGPNITDADRELIQRILGSAGLALPVEENQIDAVTALSGSGPAYVFHFIEALIQGGVALGLSEKMARDLAIQTVLGSAKLASESSLSPMELAAQVKSPRGTTLAGCALLEENDALNQLVARSMAAAKNRAEELARGQA